MRKKGKRTSAIVIGLLLFGLTACGNTKDGAENIITPTPLITPIVDQEAVKPTITETPEIQSTVDNTDADNNLKKPTSPTYIPEKLLMFIENNIKNGDDISLFSSIISDKELSVDELSNFSKDELFAEYVRMVEASSGKVLQVDADNDGVQDLYFQINDGGSMGNSSRYLLKGNTDGTYMMTDSSYFEITGELAFIEFEEKNYLLQTTSDYNSKINNGFEISCFIDGTVHERIFLSKDAVEYSTTINLENKNMESIAKNCEIIGLNQYAYKVRYNDYEVQGNAERLLKENEYRDYAKEKATSLISDVYYGADIDNDGIEEIYNKDIFFTSTRNMATLLQYQMFNAKDKDVVKECLNKIINPQMFWIEKSDEGNIICILSLDNLLDYSVYGYIITKDQIKEVFQVNFTGKMIINSAFFTIGSNLEDVIW